MDSSGISQLELMDQQNPYQNPFKGSVVQNTSFEADISIGIHQAHDEEKKNPPPQRQSIEGKKTFIQFKLNDGRVLNASVNLATTTTLELKEKCFKREINEGKSVRLVFMGKMMKDEDLLSDYKLVHMSFLSVIITKPLVRPEGAQPADGLIETTDGKVGFDRFIKMRNKLYTDMQVHQMRLVFHSLMMRSGTERTDETADGLLEKEESWLKGELVGDLSLENLIN